MSRTQTLKLHHLSVVFAARVLFPARSLPPVCSHASAFQPFAVASDMSQLDAISEEARFYALPQVTRHMLAYALRSRLFFPCLISAGYV